MVLFILEFEKYSNKLQLEQDNIILLNDFLVRFEFEVLNWGYCGHTFYTREAERALAFLMAAA